MCAEGLICAKEPLNYKVDNERVIGGSNAQPNTWKWQVNPLNTNDIFIFLSFDANRFCTVVLKY